MKIRQTVAVYFVKKVSSQVNFELRSFNGPRDLNKNYRRMDINNLRNAVFAK